MMRTEDGSTTLSGSMTVADLTMSVSLIDEDEMGDLSAGLSASPFASKAGISGKVHVVVGAWPYVP